MSTSTNIRWVDRATGVIAPCPAAEIVLRDNNLWSGIHIERWHCGPLTIDESITQTHILSVTLKRNNAEYFFLGEGWRRGSNCLGSITITPAGVPFGFRGREWRGLIMSIDPKFLKCESVTGLRVQIELRPQAFADDKFLARLALALERDIFDGHPIGPAYGESITTTLAAHLIRNFSTRSIVLPNGSGGFSKHIQAKIRDYIHSNLHRPLHLAELAKLVQMEMLAFQRAFKRAFAMPPHRYILRVRVEHAISLVAKTSLPLVEIALTCGFSSQSHMTTMFRRLAGHSPTNYRAHSKSNR